jgi:hypothetical protein
VSDSHLAELDALIAAVTVDAYGDEEQLTGFLTGAEDALNKSEPASIAGVPVEVVKVDAGPDVRRGLTAICEREGTRHEVSLVDLALPADSELGRVVAAYRRWLGCES